MKKEILALIIIFIISLIWLIFGKNGYLDFYRLKQTQKEIYQKNQQLIKENEILKKRIDRLKNDPVYLKAVIREVMGLTEEDEIMLFIKNP